MFKRLMHLSSVAIVHFINGLFGTNHPPDSTVEYPKTESVTRNLGHFISDILIVIAKTFTYHIEAQIDNDENMAVRVFEYDWQSGLLSKTVSGNVIDVKIPRSIVIYWETTKSTPKTVILRLHFYDGTTFDYKIESFKFLDYTLKELEAKNLVILLPFYLLKLRKRVNAALKLPAAKSKAKLSALSAELRKIEEELMSVLERSRKAGVISESDSLEILEHSGKMREELYSSYEEFMEEESMLLKRLETHGKEWVATREERDAAREEAKRAEQEAKRAEQKAKRAEQKAKLAEQEAKLAEQKKDREVAQLKLEKDQLVKQLEEARKR
jgi:hypothetical protein